MRLGYEDFAELLSETFDEEKETDAKLTELAESSVNNEAAQAGKGGSDDKAKTTGRKPKKQTSRVAAQISTAPIFHLHESTRLARQIQGQR